MKSRQYKRTLVVAALLAAALLLVACTPGVRHTVERLAVTIYEAFVRFTVNSSDGILRSEIENVYGFNPIPDGFELVSQSWSNPFRVDTVYKNINQESIIIVQTIPESSVASSDNEKANSFSKDIGGVEVLFSAADDICTATMLFDGYRITTQYCGRITQDNFENLISALICVD